MLMTLCLFVCGCLGAPSCICVWVFRRTLLCTCGCLGAPACGVWVFRRTLLLCVPFLSFFVHICLSCPSDTLSFILFPSIFLFFLSLFPSFSISFSFSPCIVDSRQLCFPFHDCFSMLLCLFFSLLSPSLSMCITYILCVQHDYLYCYINCYSFSLPLCSPCISPVVQRSSCDPLCIPACVGRVAPLCYVCLCVLLYYALYWIAVSYY